MTCPIVINVGNHLSFMVQKILASSKITENLYYDGFTVRVWDKTYDAFW